MATHLSAADLAHFEKKLRDREAQLREEVRESRERARREPFSRLASEAPDQEDASLAQVVVDLNSADIERDMRELQEIEEALGRIAAGTYGICLRCGEPIDRERLEAAPAAKYDRLHQELEERERGGRGMPTL